MKFSADSFIVRKFGVQGLKICSAVWFSCVYALLVGIAGRGLAAFTQLQQAQPESNRHGNFIIYFTVTLTVAAASLLTRVFLRRWNDIRELQSKTRQA
jgi:hypothetical protein